MLHVHTALGYAHNGCILVKQLQHEEDDSVQGYMFAEHNMCVGGKVLQQAARGPP